MTRCFLVQFCPGEKLWKDLVILFCLETITRTKFWYENILPGFVHFNLHLILGSVWYRVMNVGMITKVMNVGMIMTIMTEWKKKKKHVCLLLWNEFVNEECDSIKKCPFDSLWAVPCFLQFHPGMKENLHKSLQLRISQIKKTFWRDCLFALSHAFIVFSISSCLVNWFCIIKE